MTNDNIKKCWFCAKLGNCSNCKKYNNNGCKDIIEELSREQIARALGVCVRTVYRIQRSPTRLRCAVNRLTLNGYKAFVEADEMGNEILTVYSHI